MSPGEIEAGKYPGDWREQGWCCRDCGEVAWYSMSLDLRQEFAAVVAADRSGSENETPETPRTEQVRAYLAYCRRAAAELKARGSFLSPEHHPTAAGAVKMIPHRGDQAEARAIKQAFSDLTEPAP